MAGKSNLPFYLSVFQSKQLYYYLLFFYYYFPDFPEMRECGAFFSPLLLSLHLPGNWKVIFKNDAKKIFSEIKP